MILVQTSAGNEFGWISDTSEFGVMGGFACSRARGGELAEFCAFSAQSDAQWRRSSLLQCQISWR